MLKPIERKIYFYRADAGYDANRIDYPFDPTPALMHISKLPNRDRYHEDIEGNATYCWLDSFSPRITLRIGNIRRVGLPRIESAGALSDLNIPPDAGLVEQIHVIFFPDRIVGADFNFYGPRMSRLKEYLAEKAPGKCRPVTFEPLLRRDALAELEQLRDIRLFHLKTDIPSATAIAKSNRGIGRFLDSFINLKENQEVEITIKAKPYSRETIQHELLTATKELAKTPQLFGSHSKLGVSGFNVQLGKVDYVDVLSDKLISKKQIMPLDARSRTLDTESAYGAIERAYTELKVELLEAAGIKLSDREKDDAKETY